MLKNVEEITEPTLSVEDTIIIKESYCPFTIDEKPRFVEDKYTASNGMVLSYKKFKNARAIDTKSGDGGGFMLIDINSFIVGDTKTPAIESLEDTEIIWIISGGANSNGVKIISGNTGEYTVALKEFAALHQDALILTISGIVAEESCHITIDDIAADNLYYIRAGFDNVNDHIAQYECGYVYLYHNLQGVELKYNLDKNAILKYGNDVIRMRAICI